MDAGQPLELPGALCAQRKEEEWSLVCCSNISLQSLITVSGFDSAVKMKLSVKVRARHLSFNVGAHVGLK